MLGAECLESPDGWNPRDQRSGYHEFYHQRWLEHVGTTEKVFVFFSAL